MTTPSGPVEGQVDRIAVLGVALAAAASVAVAEGDWDALDLVVGVVLFVVLVSFYPWTAQVDRRTLPAVAAVTGLCVLLVVVPLLNASDFGLGGSMHVLVWLAASSLTLNVLMWRSLKRLRRGADQR